MMQSFNLVDRPWIPVLMEDGSSCEVSLLEAFSLGESIATVCGNPLEVAVLHRLMLAVAHRVCTPPSWVGWLKLWQDKPAYFARIRAYLEAKRSCFELYGPGRPFLQHPGLPAPTGTPATLVYERSQGNNPIFLDGSVVSDPQPIRSAVAARSLLVSHACGGSGTGGLNPLNGNKKDTMYAGPLCARMIAVIEGHTLWETLLMNLVAGLEAGLPSWEGPLSDRPAQTKPRGVCDLYTRATRNIRLAPGEGEDFCVGVSIVMGEGMVINESLQEDPLVPVYLSKADKTFRAKRVDVGKAVWRSADVFLAPFESETVKPLKALAQLRSVDESPELEDRRNLRMRILGAAANAQGPVTDLWQDATIPFKMDLVRGSEGYEQLLRALQVADAEADLLRRRLYRFASSYISDGGTAADKQDIERLMTELSPTLAPYWSKLAAKGELLSCKEANPDEWFREVKAAHRVAWDEAVGRLPPHARRYRAQFAQVHDSSSNSRKKKVAL